MLKYLWITLLVIVLDLLTKQWASSVLALYQPVPVLPMFNLTLMHNTGAAFSMLGDAGGWQRWFFIAAAIAISGLLLYWLLRLEAEQRWLAVALTLLLGGALGNLVDRVWLGYVVDFIDVYYDGWHWPAFNVADSAITVGAVMLVIDAVWGQSAGRAREE